MSFEVTYSGEIQYWDIFYSTKERRDDKWCGEFYKKMDAIADEINELIDDEEIEAKQEEMVALAHETLNNEALNERGGTEEYETHFDGGTLEVDGKDIDMDEELFGDDYNDFFKAQEKKWNRKDWYIIYAKSESGTFRVDPDDVKGKFDKKKIKMKNGLLHYEDEPITDAYYGTERNAVEFDIFFEDGDAKGIDIKWV